MENLLRGELLQLAPCRGAEIHLHSGSIWVTQPGDPCDYVLTAGQSLRLSGAAPVVVSAFRQACLTLVEPCAARSAAVAPA